MTSIPAASPQRDSSCPTESDPQRDSHRAPSSRPSLLLLLAILALAAFLRLDGLGEVDLRGDEVTFFLALEEGVDSFSYLVSHLRQFDHDRQMPVPRWLSATLVQAMGLPADARSTRLFFALAGIATVLACWVFGTQLGALVLEGKRRSQAAWEGEVETWWVVSLAPLLAFLAAINPYHLYWSRTAHIYVYPMVFLVWGLACAMGWLRGLAAGRERETEARLWLAGALASTILASYSHMSAWLACGVLWVFLLGAWLSYRHLGSNWSLNSMARASWPLPFWPKALLAGLVLWGLALAPWAWQFAEGVIGGTADPVWSGGANPLYEFGAMWRLPFVMTWGGGWRSLFTMALPLAAVIFGWRHSVWGPTVRLVCGCGAALFVALSLAQSTGFFAVRYYTPLWPLLILLSGLGCVCVAEAVGIWVRQQDQSRLSLLTAKRALVLVTLLVAAAMFTPLRALVALRGNPVEFSRLSRTLDETFPPETPVLVNGMNVVGVEMRPYLPETVTATFTVPDVGFEMWRDNDWRASAEDFLRRFPDAALVQQGRNFYDHPEVGPWAFPEDYFAQKIELRNEPALTLRRLLLAPSEDFSSGSVESSRSIARVFYNRPEDLIAKAKSENKSSLALFGSGWHYVKLGDFSDWRGLSQQATVVVSNLTSKPRMIDVEILFQILGTRKVLQVTAADTNEEVGAFLLKASDQLAAWTLSVEVPPGSRELQLLDPQWEAERSTLLVAAIRTPASTSAETSKAAEVPSIPSGPTSSAPNPEHTPLATPSR